MSRNATLYAQTVAVVCPVCLTPQAEQDHGSFQWEATQLIGIITCENGGCCASLALNNKTAKVER